MHKMDNTFDESFFDAKKVPVPPPSPSRSTIYPKRRINDGSSLRRYSGISKETNDLWDRLFDEGYRADVSVSTDNGGIIYAHSNVLVSLLNFDVNFIKSFAELPF